MFLVEKRPDARNEAISPPQDIHCRSSDLAEITRLLVKHINITHPRAFVKPLSEIRNL